MVDSVRFIKFIKILTKWFITNNIFEMINLYSMDNRTAYESDKLDAW